eukprot:2538629-Amphidinium_carterae.1
MRGDSWANEESLGKPRKSDISHGSAVEGEIENNHNLCAAFLSHSVAQGLVLAKALFTTLPNSG